MGHHGAGVGGLYEGGRGQLEATAGQVVSFGGQISLYRLSSSGHSDSAYAPLPLWRERRWEPGLVSWGIVDKRSTQYPGLST